AFRIRADGTIYIAGFGSMSLLLPAITWAQYEHLRTTYAAGGYSGLVTVGTRTTGDTYANYNAVLRLPTPEEMERQFTHWLGVPLRLTRMQVIP
ncbi:MAG: hypothetical protein CUN54_09395, partial [Phototrophicales bacterium]